MPCLEGRTYLLKQAAALKAFASHPHGPWGAFLFRYLERDPSRDRAFAAWSCAAQASDGTISPEALDDLPGDLRQREARRHLTQCPALTSRAEKRLAYARLLPFEDAKSVLSPWLGHPEGDPRALGQRTLIASPTHKHSP